MDKELESFLKDLKADPESDKEERWEYIYNLDSWETMPISASIDFVGKMIDYSFDLGKEEGLTQGIEICQILLSEKDATIPERCLIHYQLANGYAYRNQLDRKRKQTEKWENENLLKEFIHLRSALHERGVEEIPEDTKLRIYTNLGNSYSRSGRVVEAIEYWNKAIEEASFPMAFGSRGIGKFRYATGLHDPGHKEIFFNSSDEDLKKAIESGMLSPGQREAFKQHRKIIEPYCSEKDVLNNEDNFSLGDTEQEKQYRRWCLVHRLFLNPLNDLTIKTIAAQDVLHLPNMIQNINEGFPYPGFYNQLKQEYVSARYLFFEGLSRDDTHLSDKHVLTINTLDYPVYSYSAEQMKAGLRLAYSIFDKIAVFLNEYFDFGHSKAKINFRKIWYQDLNYKNGLKDIFTNSMNSNWFLKALYWLRKDFYGGPLDIDQTDDLIVRELKDIRNHLEHKYLKVHQFSPRENENEEQLMSIYDNQLKHSISIDDLKNYGQKMLKTARAALIYLSLSINICERKKAEELSDEPLVSMPSDIYEDEWKI